MKVGYAMIRNPTDLIEDQIDLLKGYGCELIYKELIYEKEDQRHVLSELLENLEPESILAIESLKIVAPKMDSPIGLAEVLIERGCKLHLVSDNKTLDKNDLMHFSSFWSEMLRFRGTVKSRWTKKGIKEMQEKQGD